MNQLNAGNTMKVKINFPVLLLLFLPILTLAQTNTLQGTCSFLTFMENAEDIALPELSRNHYLEFAENGASSSSIACNGIGGKFLLGAKGKIKFNSLKISAKACFGENLKVEQSFSRVLKEITRYRIKGDVLTLQDERG
jgi:heat shock protein HslJ